MLAAAIWYIDGFGQEVKTKRRTSEHRAKQRIPETVSHKCQAIVAMGSPRYPRRALELKIDECIILHNSTEKNEGNQDHVHREPETAGPSLDYEFVIGTLLEDI